ncbi:hypothetical protein FSST1_006887 [Fusarium sambucinum]
MRFQAIWGIVGFAVGISGKPTSNPNLPVVTIKNGTYTGFHSTSFDQDFFLGVPYAQPPVGNLRFRTPQPLNATWVDKKPAGNYSDACIGYGTDDSAYKTSEDCLYLNVVRPSHTKENLPVLVWIHGGGLIEGSAVDQRYNLSFIVQQSVAIGKPIVAVSINYRLGVLGFVNSLEIADSENTNLGLKGQRLALHWIQENISAFGGDPSRVIIWSSYDQLLNATGCNASSNNLQCLRGVPIQNLDKIFSASQNLWAAFGPSNDGDFIRGSDSELLANGHFVCVPILTSTNTDEGTYFASQPPTPKNISTDTEFMSYLQGIQSLPAAFAQQVAKAYPDIPDDGVPGVPTLPADYRPGYPYGTQWRRIAAYLGDSVIIAHKRLTSQIWTAAGLNVYSYRFDIIPASIPDIFGVSHVQEIPFVFFNLEGVGYNKENLLPWNGTQKPFEDRGKDYIEAARLMCSSWISFVYDQNPNSFRMSGRFAGDHSLPIWPPYSEGGRNGTNLVFRSDFRSHLEPDSFRFDAINLLNAANHNNGMQG